MAFRIDKYQGRLREEDRARSRPHLPSWLWLLMLVVAANFALIAFFVSPRVKAAGERIDRAEALESRYVIVEKGTYFRVPRQAYMLHEAHSWFTVAFTFVFFVAFIIVAIRMSLASAQRR